MKDHLTEIVFILDRSGSMMNLTADTIGGYNSMIEKQKQEPGEAKITTVLFDDNYDVLYDAVDIQNVEPMTNAQYYARGCTALLDAIGKTINSVGARLNNTPEEERPSKVIVVITTDGYENSSHEFTRSKIKEMIEHQTTKYSWQFMFLGADIDAVVEAESIGISGDWAVKTSATDVGTRSVYVCLDSAIRTLRSGEAMTKNLTACYADSEASAATEMNR